MCSLRATPRLLVLFLTACIAVYFLVILPSQPSPLKGSSLLPEFVKDRLPSAAVTTKVDKAKLETLSLTEKQCRATFPGLMREIDDAVEDGPFDLEPNLGTGTGPLQAQIKDGKIWILDAPRRGDLSQDMREVSNDDGCLNFAKN
jgi:hypothetical protein